MSCLLDSKQINELCNFADMSDEETQIDLSRGIIKNENDYTSNFTGTLRRKINSCSKTGLAAISTPSLLSWSDERKTGCDAAIIVSSGGESKIAIYEAKWPRLSHKAPHRWDSIQKSNSKSHFSDQLERQASYTSIYAVFEMFYCEWSIAHPQQLPCMQDRGSSCVWHIQAKNFDKQQRAGRKNQIWSQADVISLLQTDNASVGEILKKFWRMSIWTTNPKNY